MTTRRVLVNSGYPFSHTQAQCTVAKIDDAREYNDIEKFSFRRLQLFTRPCIYPSIFYGAPT
jgi:hypothetical protein